MPNCYVAFRPSLSCDVPVVRRSVDSPLVNDRRFHRLRNRRPVDWNPPNRLRRH